MTELHNTNYKYKMFQNEEYYTVNKCYEIIYNDLKELNI